LQMFSIYVFLAFYFITKLLVIYRSNWLLLFVVFILIFLLTTLKLDSDLIVQILVFAMMLLAFILFHLPRQLQLKSLLTTTVIFLGVFAVFFIIMSLIQPAKTYDKHAIVKNVEENIRAKQMDIQYEKDKTNNFTNGDFTRLEALQLEDETALEV